MICEKCKKDIPDDAVFCPYCGDVPHGEAKKTKVRTSEVEVFVDEIDEEIARRKKAIPLYIGLIVLGAFLSIFGALRALTNFISSGDRMFFGMAYSFVVSPAILLAAWGIVGIAIAGNRKIARKTLQKKKKYQGEQRQPTK